MAILNINGKPYTTAMEDLRLDNLKHKFRQLLSKVVTSALQRAKGPKMAIEFQEIDNFIEQVYFMGRDD